MRKLALISSLAATQAAGDFALQMPVDCTLGDTCYIQQFLDHDPSRGTQDFMCGDLTYDGHKGTDFALASRADQAAGVNVLAAADGTVMGVRNDMKDVLQTGPDAPDVSDRECGNGIVIRHDGGYETQYCHLAQGSVTVMAGQQISAGDIIGQIGLSGQTQFPHLHLSLRKNGSLMRSRLAQPILASHPTALRWSAGGSFLVCGSVMTCAWISRPPTAAALVTQSTSHATKHAFSVPLANARRKAAGLREYTVWM